ncbi:hypothetical protein ACFL6C_06480 [Myxococcota bacterium]
MRRSLVFALVAGWVMPTQALAEEENRGVTVMDVGMGVTVAGLIVTGVGIGFGISAGNDLDEIQAKRGISQVEVVRLEKDANEKVTRANQVLISGSVATAVGVGLLAFGLATDTEPIVAMAPTEGGAIATMRLVW